ncbi:hypothetical protein [Tenacibaculum sp. nBUS_03]|uniref:hypothetical protein n=1 Tax=Tenacibaculum sp. nBUS_03 TaxID=3395320 RepID=UPI003EBFCD6F
MVSNKERIYFNAMTSKFWIGVLIVSIILLIMGLFGFFTNENNKWNYVLMAFAHFTQAVYFLKDFRYKNYVRYNKLGMVLKIQSYWGKSISFNELTKVELTDNSLIIYKNKNETLVCSTTTIRKEDSKKLYTLLNAKINEKRK